MSALDSKFQQALQDVLSTTSGTTVGATAGYCAMTGPVTERGIVYAGRIEPRGPRPIVASPGPDTLWQIGSVTKTFTAALLARKAAENPQLLTALVEPDIDRWLPQSSAIPGQLGLITYNRLVSMWAGLVDSYRGSAPPGSLPVPTLFENLLEPGSYTDAPYDWLYSNLSIALLGWALTSVYGVAPASASDLPAAYLDLLNQQLLEPLNIDATWAQDADVNRLPVGWVGDQRNTMLDADWPADDPAGALTLTAPDLLAWVEANLQPGPVLSGSMLQLLRTPLVPTGHQVESESGGTIVSGGSSCRGWFLVPSQQISSGWLYNKNGRVAGFQASVAYAQPASLDGTSSAGVFFTINDSGKSIAAEKIAEHLLSIVLDQPA